MRLLFPRAGVFICVLPKFIGGKSSVEKVKTHQKAYENSIPTILSQPLSVLRQSTPS
jgi:hypothetical protein